MSAVSPFPPTPTHPPAPKKHNKFLNITVHSPKPRRLLPLHPAPRSPYPWLWRCHKCHRIYRFGAARNRCLSCSHRFCTKCISEIDYDGWEAWGEYWRPFKESDSQEDEKISPLSPGSSSDSSPSFSDIAEDDGVDILCGRKWLPWSLYGSSSEEDSSSESEEEEEGEISEPSRGRKKHKDRKLPPTLLPITSAGIPLPELDRLAFRASEEAGSYDCGLDLQLPLSQQSHDASPTSNGSYSSSQESCWDPLLTYDVAEERSEEEEVAMISPGSPPPPERWLTDVSANRGTILERRCRAAGKENLPPPPAGNEAAAVDEGVGMEELAMEDEDGGVFVLEDLPRYEPIVLPWPEE